MTVDGLTTSVAAISAFDRPRDERECLPLPLGEPPQPVRLDPPTWLPGELGNQPPRHLRRDQSLAGGHHADSRVAAVMHEDRRFIAGVNLDGLFVGPVLDEGLSRPFLVFGSDYHDEVFDPSWAKVLPRLSGWHRWFRLVGSGHYRFIDLGGSVRKWGLDTTLKPADPETWRTVFGDIDDALSQEIVVRVTTAFFERHVRHRSEPILHIPTDYYAELEDRTDTIG